MGFASKNVRFLYLTTALVLVVLRAQCKSFPSFDSYAKTCNTVPLNKLAHSSSSCK